MKYGKQLYADDVKNAPRYHDGTNRKTWEQLQPVIQQHWEKMANEKHKALQAGNKQ